MKDYKKASGDLVKFLHQLEHSSRKLSSHSKIGKFLKAGVLPPDLHAAIAYVEMAYSVEIAREPTDSDGLAGLTPREFCMTYLKEKKLRQSSLRKSMRLVAEIYRDHIKAGPSAGPN